MADPVINIAEVDAHPMAPEGGSKRFGAMVAPVGAAVGLKGLGLMVTEVEPGKRAFPYHNHLANDEAFVILDGEGTYRFGGKEFPVRSGDICGAPRGGPDTAHQLINTGTVPLRYLGISTMRDPEIVEYPDSAKYGAMAIAPGTSFYDAHFKIIGRAGAGLDYWDGEET